MIIVYDNYAFARFTAPDHITIDYSFELCFLSSLMSGPPGKKIQRMVLLMIIEAQQMTDKSGQDNHDLQKAGQTHV